MLTIENVSKKFRGGNFSVRDLSLEVKSGVIGLLGPNGAGKTTLMQMLATITRSSSGRILFHGEDVVKKPNDLRRRLGYLPQDFGVCALVVAIVFVAAIATALGVMTSNPKTFIVGFLTFWYVVVNDRGANPLLDFAGFYDHASVASILLYVTLSVVALAAAEMFYRVRLSRA